MPTWEGGTALLSALATPYQLVVRSSWALLVQDSGNARVWEVTPKGLVSTLGGTGSAGWVDGFCARAQLSTSTGVATTALDSIAYVAEQQQL